MNQTYIFHISVSIVLPQHACNLLRLLQLASKRSQLPLTCCNYLGNLLESKITYHQKAGAKMRYWLSLFTGFRGNSTRFWKLSTNSNVISINPANLLEFHDLQNLADSRNRVLTLEMENLAMECNATRIFKRFWKQINQTIRIGCSSCRMCFHYGSIDAPARQSVEALLVSRTSFLEYHIGLVRYHDHDAEASCMHSMYKKVHWMVLLVEESAHMFS